MNPAMPTPDQIRRDYLRGWNASKTGGEVEPKHSLDAFDAGYEDEQAGNRKFKNLPQD